jgi:hypothetical protein
MKGAAQAAPFGLYVQLLAATLAHAGGAGYVGGPTQGVLAKAL